MATVYIEKEDDLKAVRLTNGTGEALAQFELVVISGHIYVANEAIASGAIGPFAIVDDVTFQISDFIDGEGTFGTENAIVYWDPSSGDFSDTSTATYYPIGIVQVDINSNSVVRVLGDRITTVVPAASGE